MLIDAVPGRYLDLSRWEHPPFCIKLIRLIVSCLITVLIPSLVQAQVPFEASDLRLPSPARGYSPHAEDTPPASARVFFATDRRLDEASRFTDRFANAESPTSDVWCGELAPADESSIGEFRGDVELVTGTTLSSKQDCIDNLSSAVGEAGGELLLFVHGYRKSFQDATKRALAFVRDAGLGGVVVIWSWPSAGQATSYSFDTESIEWSKPNFAAFVYDLLASEQVSRIDFFAHSMGARLVADLMRDHWPGQPSAVVLYAADVARPILRQALANANTAVPTLLATNLDMALIASQKINQRQRAGKANPLMLVSGMDTIDLSAFDEMWSAIWLQHWNHSHAFFVPEVISDLSTLLSGSWHAEDRGLKPLYVQSTGLEYYFISPRKTGFPIP